jgi:hypothetical protein
MKKSAQRYTAPLYVENNIELDKGQVNLEGRIENAEFV